MFINFNDNSYIHVSFVFFPFVVERKLFIASATSSAILRDHSASFRDMHFTYNFRDLVFLVFASATTAPLRFPRFLVVVGFISFHFGLLGLHLLSFLAFLLLLLHSFVLGLDFARASAGSTVVWACVPSAVLPRSFRAASAKHRSKTCNQTHTA